MIIKHIDTKNFRDALEKDEISVDQIYALLDEAEEQKTLIYCLQRDLNSMAVRLNKTEDDLYAVRAERDELRNWQKSAQLELENFLSIVKELKRIDFPTTAFVGVAVAVTVDKVRELLATLPLPLEVE